MNHLCLPGISRRQSCHPVAKAHANGNKHITLLLFHVWRIVAVHAKHAHIERMARGQRRQAEQRTGCRYARFLDKLKQFVMGVAQLYALPYQCQRSLGIIDQCSRLGYGVFVGRWVRHIASHKIHVRRFPFCHVNLCILWEVEHHRAGPSRPCDIESAAHCPRNVFRTPYLIAPF